MNNYKEILLAKRQELAEKLMRREGIVIERTPDALEDVQRSAEREFAITVLDRDRTTLKSIDLALERIDDGVFGICERCEEEISVKRLNAIPWAAYCISCQEAVDEESGAYTREDVLFSDAA